MKEIKRLPFWTEACELGKELHHLTNGPARDNTTIHLLRQRSEALAIATAIAPIDCNKPDYGTSLRGAFECCHDTEYLLFRSLWLRYLPHDAIGGLYGRIERIKRSLVVLVNERYNTSASSVHRYNAAACDRSEKR